MPHIQIDYSPNLDQRLDVAGLCRVLRDAAVSTGVLPLAGIRVRAGGILNLIGGKDVPRSRGEGV